jgi:hypothetical protein
MTAMQLCAACKSYSAGNMQLTMMVLHHRNQHM